MGANNKIGYIISENYLHENPIWMNARRRYYYCFVFYYSDEGPTRYILYVCYIHAALLQNIVDDNKIKFALNTCPSKHFSMHKWKFSQSFAEKTPLNSPGCRELWNCWYRRTTANVYYSSAWFFFFQTSKWKVYGKKKCNIKL